MSGAVQYGASYTYISPGFETNDLGFLPRADYQSVFTQLSLQSRKPQAFWRNASASVQGQADYTAGGLPIYNFVQLQAYTQFQNNTQLTVTGWSDNVLPAYCDRCARGGPALRLSAASNLLVNLQADTRKRIVPYVAAIYTSADGGARASGG